MHQRQLGWRGSTRPPRGFLGRRGSPTLGRFDSGAAPLGLSPGIHQTLPVLEMLETGPSRYLNSSADPDREGEYVLRVEHVQAPASDEPRQAGGCDAAEHYRGSTAALSTLPPPDRSDCTQPGGGDRRDPIVGSRDESLERAGLDEPCQTDDGIPEHRRERLTREGCEPEDPAAAECERKERKDAEREQRPDKRGRRDRAVRYQQPDASIRYLARTGSETGEWNHADALEGGQGANNRHQGEDGSEASPASRCCSCPHDRATVR